MLKNIFKIIIVFIFGIAGGIFADQILWPYFIERPLFYEYRLEQRPVYLTETKEIIIQENVALQEAIGKVEKAVIAVRTETKTGKVLQGSGLIVTSDGLLITLADIVPQGATFSFWVDGKRPTFQILKRDIKNNLALVKIEETNLSTVGFADFGAIKQGQRVFLVGSIPPDPRKTFTSQIIVNQGIIRNFSSDLVQTNIIEQENLQGSPLFDIEGNVVGLNSVSKQGQIIAIPIPKIKAFLNF